MDQAQAIKELQKKIGELSSQLENYQQTLFMLQREINRLQHKEISGQAGVNPIPSRNFRWENFIGLRIIHLVGIVVLVMGLSIGVKYAIDKQLISEIMRIILAYIAGIILYLLSWQTRKKYQLFSAILFSGAMASLYFTTYAAFVYYGFFSFALVFLLMALYTVYTAFESIRYNRQEIAILGMIGAYGIPFLISANNERADLFFSYIILINAGIVYLSFKKKWKLMGQLALLTTWTLFILWGFFRYESKDLLTGSVLLGAFYLLFTLNGLAYRLVRSESLTVGDIQQVALNNIALYFSALLVFGEGKFGNHLAAVTGCVAICLSLFAFLSYLNFSTEKVFQQSLALQAVILVSMFIGFYWNGFFVTILWIAFAIGLFAWGIFNHRSWPRLAAMLLMGVTLGKLIIFDSSKFSTLQKIIAYLAIGILLLVLSFFYQKFKLTLFQNRDLKG